MLKFSFPSFVTANVPINESDLKDKAQALQKILHSSEVGFFHHLDLPGQLASCQKVYEKFRHKKYFFHVGIGGSSLGPEMLVQALKNTETSTQFTFINNIDPDTLQEQLSVLLDPARPKLYQEALFYFVSKSGSTAETMAAFSVIHDLLKKKGVSAKELKNFLVLATDPGSGDLRQLGQELELSILDIPKNVGGRFSALTVVGLLPCLFLGIKMDELPRHFADIRDYLSAPVSKEHPLYLLGQILAHLKSQENIQQTVLMPYSSKLQKFSAWFVQLWAESLGKKQTGLTPVAAFGATDQHAQMQLFKEGTRDKFILFIEVGRFQQDFSLMSDFNYPSLKKLSTHPLSKLMKAELEGTLKAMEEAQRPFALIQIPQLDLPSLVHLLLFFETLTVLMGLHLEIDPFNQPGVEAGKLYAFEYLARSH